MSDVLPIEALREAALAQLSEGPLVLSAPTGSGKSTQVPRWLMARGRTLVVEPRRVACRALAGRVAELEGAQLGREVGYVVRAERQAREDTQLLFVTPGVALRMMRDGAARAFRTIVLDEFHERSLDLDLLLALLTAQAEAELVIMSATLQGDRVAAHVGGAHLSGEGRQFPVEIRHEPGRAVIPDVRGLEDRVLAALRRAESDAGDVLVFLPGKGEIRSVAGRLARGPWEVLELHGGLSLQQQSRIFAPHTERRVILSTNVAETSLTVPGIGVVIDAGLARRTRYHNGRGYLTLLPIAQDSAAQRAGRAGRLGPGICYRLWRQDAPLDPVTPPEVYRESLVPLVLAARACGARVGALPFLDPPKDYAVEDALEQLDQLGAFDADGRLSERGQRLFSLPIDAALARLLVEGEARGLLDLVIPLCAALGVDRRLFQGRPADPELDLREQGCDAVALIRAVREGRPGPHQLDPKALEEAHALAERFDALFGAPAQLHHPLTHREALAQCVLAAWPRCAHVARRRRRHVAWSNGGTELELGRDSAVDEEKVDVLLMLDSRAMGKDRLDRRLILTLGMPVPDAWLVAAGRGREHLAGVQHKHGEILCRFERVYAGRVIHVSERTPSGAAAREAIQQLFLRGSLYQNMRQEAERRHQRVSLAAELVGDTPPPPFEAWVLQRLQALGLEEVEDLALLSGEDLLPEALDAAQEAELDWRFPAELSLGDARYIILYDVSSRRAILDQVAGSRKTPPPDRVWPRLAGWTLVWRHKNRERVLRR